MCHEALAHKWHVRVDARHMVMVQPLIKLHLHHEMFVEKGQDHLKAVVLHQTILSGAQAKLPASQGIQCIVQHAGVVHKAVTRV